MIKFSLTQGKAEERNYKNRYLFMHYLFTDK